MTFRATPEGEPSPVYRRLKDAWESAEQTAATCFHVDPCEHDYDENATFQLLLDYIEEHGLAGTELDPRAKPDSDEEVPF